MFEAVILAGGGNTDPLAQSAGVRNKSFISVQDSPLVSYILHALSSCPDIGKVVVVGPEEELRTLQDRGYSFKAVPEKDSMLDNMGAGLEEVDPDKLCLLSTGDIPLVNADILGKYLALCAPYDSDFYYPVVTEQSCRQKFPQTKRTCVRLKEGVFTGGNLALIRPSWFKKNRSRLETFITYRKNPLKLLRIFPLRLILKFVVGRLSLGDLERYLSHGFQLSARAIPCPYPELATDVDKFSDLEVVNGELSTRSPASNQSY